MHITDVRVRKVSKEGKMKAVVSITIDDEFERGTLGNEDHTKRYYQVIW